MEEIIHKFEKGVIVPDAEPRTVPNTQKELDESLDIKAPPLEPHDLFDLLQSKIEYKLNKAYNTIHEYNRIIETGEIVYPDYKKEQEAMYERLATGKKDTGPKMYREAMLCQYTSFIVKGPLTTEVDDDYWIGKIAKWYALQIERGTMSNIVLGCLAMEMSLYDPVNNTHISLDKEGRKYIATRLTGFGDVKEQQEAYKRRTPVEVLSMYAGFDVVGKRREYTAQDIEKFEKKTMYCLYLFPSPAASKAEGYAYSVLSKLVQPGQFIGGPKRFYNNLTNVNWFVNEGEMPPQQYDIIEQVRGESIIDENPHKLPQDVL